MTKDEVLREAKKVLMEAIIWLQNEMPDPSHEGSCGPESGCDGICMERSDIGHTLSRWNAVLTELEKIQ